MLQACNGAFYAATVRMLLASPTVRTCVIAPDLLSADLKYGLQGVVIKDAATLADCVNLLTVSDSVKITDASAVLRRCYLAYPSQRPIAVIDSSRKLECMAASEFVRSTARTEHVDIRSFDISAEVFASSVAARRLRSLDISRLDLDDKAITTLALAGQFPNLRWLDLSGNSRVTLAGVEALAKAVAEGRLQSLQWLDLLGTDCDATPFVDGYYWRMTETAQYLGRRYGYQPWMMLGSKIPEMAGKELLNSDQRRVPPNRFNLP